MVLEKTLERVPWTTRRSNQSILNKVNPEYSLEGLRLKLKLQYFGRLIQRADSEKTLMLGKIEGRRRRGQPRMRWLNGITSLMDMSLSKLQELQLLPGMPPNTEKKVRNTFPPKLQSPPVPLTGKPNIELVFKSAWES